MSPRWRTVALIAAFALTLGAARILFGDRFEPAALVAWLRSLGSSVVAIPAYGLVFGVATTLLTPAMAMIMVGGVMWGFWPGWVIIWCTVNVCAHAQFALGRSLGRDSVRSWLERRRAAWIVRELEHGGVLATILIRQLPLPFVGVNVAAGASPIPWPKWVAGNALGLLAPSVVYSQLAAAIADGVEGAEGRAVQRVLLTAGSIIALALLTRWVQRRFGRQVPVGARE